MAYTNFDKLRVFFFALKRTQFHPERIPLQGRIIMNGRWATIDRAECFNLLRAKIPDLKGKNDKEVSEYLRSPRNINRILAEFTPKEQIELGKALAGTPVVTAGISTQAGGQEAVIGPIPPVNAPTTAPLVGMPPMPSAPSVYSQPRIINNVPQAAPAIPETTQPQIAIANKTGVVAEPPPTKFHVTDNAGNISATYSKEPLPAAAQPKLVIARSDGSIVKPTTLPSKISVVEKGGIREHTIPTQRRYNFSALGSRIGNGIGIALERANPFLKRAGNGLVNSLTSIANPGGMGGIGSRSILGGFGRGGGSGDVSRSIFGGTGGTPSGGVKKFVSTERKVALVALLFLLLFGVVLFSSTTPIGETAPISSPTPAPVSDISSCKFTRGGDSVKELTYQSPLLLSYIQAASNLTNIPAVVLAAFIRVETPSTVTKNDDAIRALSSVAACPTSPTGALGVMQLQPKGTTGHDDKAITNGAKLIGKTYDQLTQEDYCDVQKNIIMGAGFILKKMSYAGYGDSTRWDPSWTNNRTAIEALVNGYYGCLDYGGSTDCTGPYNYADDVLTSIQNCQVTTKPAPSIGPVPTEKLAQVVYWAQIINSALESGLPPSSYNKMVANITNGTYTATVRQALNRDNLDSTGIYWCTNLVIDAYNLANITGLGAYQQGVRSMIDFWQHTNNYVFIPYNGSSGIASIKLVKPGFALFRIYPDNYQYDHASIIQEFQVNDRGDGHITTLDSNSSKSWTSNISSGVITDQSFISPIVGFGGIAQ